MPAGSRERQLVCLEESRVAEEHAAKNGTEEVPGSRRWAGGGDRGGGATSVFRVRVCPPALSVETANLFPRAHTHDLKIWALGSHSP